jgi:hypothetical protein
MGEGDFKVIGIGTTIFIGLAIIATFFVRFTVHKQFVLLPYSLELFLVSILSHLVFGSSHRSA